MDVRQKLHQIAGIQPSQHWLEDCCNELQLTGEADCSDAVLHQVLHHDLRDVVRVFEEVPVNPNSPAVLLRRAIQESQTLQSKKALLPESFRLLVQVEELLDVSLNAEARLAVGPASRSAPTAVGNQQNRCLKMALSDGYTSTGSPYYTENDNPHFTLIAMEITPIQALSVNSNAGIKVLLKGPIEIRHGVLFWHPGNATVLGGKVPELVEMQIQALEQAKLRAGVGVDPTVKALIWNSETGDMEEADDEGEHESRDVPAAPQAQPQPTMASVPQAPLQARQSVPTAPPVQPPPAPPILTRVQPPAVQQPSATARHEAAAAAQRLPRTQLPAPSLTSPPVSRVNPYVTGTSSQKLSRNPYGSSQSSSRNQYPSSQQTPATAHQPLPPNQDMTRSLSNSTTPASLAVAAVSTMPQSSQAEAIAFGELRSRLVRAREDENLYRQLYRQTYVCQIKQQGFKLYFDTQKKRNLTKADKKKGDKYEYVLWAKFQGPLESDGLVTCQVAGAILDPCFSKSASEMRKLNRENRQKAQEVVKEGGKLVQDTLFKLTSYEVTLLRSPDDFFRPEKDAKPAVDGGNPVLYIVKKV